MNSILSRSRFSKKIVGFLSFTPSILFLTFISCSVEIKTSEPKVKKSEVHLEDPAKTKISAKTVTTPEKINKSNQEKEREWWEGDKSSEWINKKFHEIQKEEKAFRKYRRMNDREFAIFGDKLNEFLEEYLIDIRKAKAEGRSMRPLFKNN